MSASIDSDAGWSAYEKFSAEMPSTSRGDKVMVVLSSILIVGLAMIVVLGYLPGGAV